jgi:hypothetical protein
MGLAPGDDEAIALIDRATGDEPPGGGSPRSAAWATTTPSPGADQTRG